MNEQEVLEHQLSRVESDRHTVWERIRQIDAFLGEGVVQMVNTCLAQKYELKKRLSQFADKSDRIRVQLRKLGGPDWKCTCPEFIHTGQCDHMERVSELVSREED